MGYQDTMFDVDTTTYAPVLTLSALGNLQTELVQGAAYQSPLIGSKGSVTGYETKYYDDITYYLIDEGVSGLDLFQLSASDADTATSSLTYAAPYLTYASAIYVPQVAVFSINSDILSLDSPFEYSDQGASYNRYSISVSVSDGDPQSADANEKLYFQVTEVADVLQYGDAGNNTFDGFATGYSGIDGGDGVDTVNYNLESENASFGSVSSGLNVNATTTVYSGSEGTPLEFQTPVTSTDSETLSNIERLYFTDKAYALDLDGNAGIAAKAIIATFGASDISTYMKAALSIVDKGTTLDELCDLVISGGYIESSAGGSDMSSFVEYVYGNVVGRELNAFEKAMMENISTGGSTKAELLKLAVQTDDVASQITTNAIDLIGVAGSSDGEKLVISFDV